MDSITELSVLPLDVVQIVLGYVHDTRSVAAARQACRSWLKATKAAACTIKVALPSSVPEMEEKVDTFMQLVPGLAGFLAAINSTPEQSFSLYCFTSLKRFTALKQLELSFADSIDFSTEDLTHLAMLTGLTSLRFHNTSLPASSDSSMLTQLQGLKELSLVHVSKVSALMAGDNHLQVIGRLGGLTHLVLQGRMCSATDDGLIALTGLNSLASLSISWVPWQSQISQRAALQLLFSLKKLKILQLGGAELLLPSAPYHPAAAAAAPTGAPSPAGAEHNLLNLNLIGQQGLIAAAVAAVARADEPRNGMPAAASQSALQGEYMRKVLTVCAEGLETFKLQFNCCGTGVEKALLSIGDVRRKLTGLQWSYAKLTGPSSVSLLATCTSLRSLKLRLWYQDYNLSPFEFKLSELAPLVNLKTLVIDKRPPFQQQLPAQQAAVSLPITAPMLSQLSGAWLHLEKLQLGLARSDFGHNCFEGLTGFTNLKSLSVHCYDQGYDDGHFMLPVNVSSLPSSLMKLDLMHAELFTTYNSSSSSIATSSSNAAAAAASSSSGVDNLRSYTSHGVQSASSSSGKPSSSSSKIGFAAATAFTSMLSESFSLLSRQASLENSAAYVNRNNAALHGQTASPAPSSSSAAKSATGPSKPSRPGSEAVPHQGSALGLNPGSSKPGQSSKACGGAFHPSGSWLGEMLLSGSSAAVAAAGEGGEGSSASGSRPSRSQLHKQQQVTPKDTAGTADAAGECSRAATAAVPGVSGKTEAASSSDTAFGNKSDQQKQPPAASPPAAAAAVPVPRPARLQNPFAAAAAAAAVNAELGGCVTAIDPAIAAAAAAALGADQQHVTNLGLPMMTEPVAAVSAITSQQTDNKNNKLSSTGSGFGRSFSVNFGRHFGKHCKAAAVADAATEAACTGAVQSAPDLPRLQHLQLKHCAMDGLCLSDVITAPAELRSCQLVEVCGLTPRDIAMMPMLAALQRLTLIAAREDAWLGLAPLRLLSRLPELRHLDWVVSDRALPARHKATDLQQLAHFSKLQVITLHQMLGKCEQLHAVSGQLPGGCHVRLMAPAYCEHAGRRSGSAIGKLLGAASCLIPGSGH